MTKISLRSISLILFIILSPPPSLSLGESGLGKSTLVNSLFLTDLYKDRKVLNAEERLAQTVGITKNTVCIEEKGVKLKLNIVDTQGYGDTINNTDSYKCVSDYIDHQFEQYRRDEIGLNRKNIQDNRVHCCLYFISPFGHGLRPLDVECMRALQDKVNIIPVVAKSDGLTYDEVKKKKSRILSEIDKYRLKIYQFPDCDSDEDEEFRRQDMELKRSVPFAVIGSNMVVDVNGRRIRARLYPWGVVEVENPYHSDFVHLRNMLVRTHMQDLKDMTHDTHYESYRAQWLCKSQHTDVEARKNSEVGAMFISMQRSTDRGAKVVSHLLHSGLSWLWLPGGLVTMLFASTSLIYQLGASHSSRGDYEKGVGHLTNAIDVCS
ncbi:septin-5-like [Oncorhynchus keta]|uniref:septin-5-like n=1 Tax=Oncorhynchus keta TaxID=8018 RepID=UPI00227BAD5E|nr:septin-5-like [Oncorhynchus keta]